MTENRQIVIIDAGPGWMAIDKPEGISVHNESGNDVVSFVARKLKEDENLRRLTASGDSYTVGPAHRLDRETSGVMIVGLNKKALSCLARQFESKKKKKEYIALVHGYFNVPPGTEFLWNYPLSPVSSGRKNIGGRGKKQECATHVTHLEQGERYSLIACEPLSGRIHQIRRHAAMSGHPVLGDERYGSKKAVNYLKTHGLFNRLGLHSRSLTIQTHEEGLRRTFQSSVPESFVQLLRGGLQNIMNEK